jgi:outer membrane biosynthesis protein TonB
MHFQDKDPIDDAFRRAFDELPEVPASSGWDAPSEKVWAGIQTGMPTTPKSNFRMYLIAALGVTAMIAALFWMLRQPASVSVSPRAQPPAPVEVPVAVPVPAPSAIQVPKEEAHPAPTVQKSKHKHKATAPAPAHSDEAPAASKHPAQPGTSMPLPGSEQVPRNTTEKRQKTEGGKQEYRK